MTDDKDLTMTLLGKKYSVTYELVHIDKLKYYPRNPRIAARISEAGLDSNDMYSDEFQERLGELMYKESSVKNLIPDIENHCGVTEDILVHVQNYEVIEGNSRLAAMRKLHARDGDPDKWNMIPCKLVEQLLPEAIDACLHQTHVKGKTPWSAYEKANMAYQRIEVEETYDVEEYCRITSQSKQAVKQQIDSIKYMHENKDKEKENFSYYHEALVKNRVISAEIENNDGLKKKLFEEIKNEKKDFSAQDLRTKLPVIIESKKNLRKYMKTDENEKSEKSETLHDAYDLAKKIKPIEKVKEAKKRLADIEKKHIDKAEKSDLNALNKEIRQCRQALKRVVKMVEKAIEEVSRD